MPGTEELTEEEKQVLGLMAFGRTTKEVSGELGLSPKTVRVRMKSILTKLHVHLPLDPPPLPPAAVSGTRRPASAGRRRANARR